MAAARSEWQPTTVGTEDVSFPSQSLVAASSLAADAKLELPKYLLALAPDLLKLVNTSPSKTLEPLPLEYRLLALPLARTLSSSLYKLPGSTPLLFLALAGHSCRLSVSSLLPFLLLLTFRKN